MSGFRWGKRFGTPYYGASAGTLSQVPGIFPVALDGIGFMIDWKAETPLSHIPVETLRQQFDATDAPGEQSLNPEGLWRRSVESWHVGAGQMYYDKKGADPFRFDTSQGVDIWTRWQLSLLNATVQKAASANTNLRLVTAGGYIYYTDGTALKYTTDIVSVALTTVTGTPGVAPSSIATNGFHVWTAHGASGIYRTTRGAATTASHITGTVSLLGYVRNRVMAANAASLYDVSALATGGGGALPAAFYTHPNSDFSWVGFAEGSGNIYMAGFSGDKSLIYRTAVVQDATTLAQPVVAAELPDGEIVTSIFGYLGKFLMIGTNKGLRFAIVQSSGDLSVGARIDTDNSVLAFEGQDEFIWYSLTNFTGADTGLGRLSTATFSDIDNLVPAYASDLMVTGQGNVQSVTTFNNRRVFTVNGLGLYYEDLTTPVAEGYVDSGRITFNMNEPKIGMWIDCQHMMDAGSFEVFVSADDQGFVSIGTRDADVHPMPSNGVGQVSAEIFEVRFRLIRDVSDNSSPVLFNWLFRAQPQPSTTLAIYATILLAPEVETPSGNLVVYNTDDIMNFLAERHREKRVINWQQGRKSYSVVLESYKYDVHDLIYYPDGPSGNAASCVLKMKEVA